MTKKISPCPFCGGEATDTVFAGQYVVKCDNCGAQVPFDYPMDKVFAAWNRRESGNIQRKTNYELILNMSIEEMAVTLMCPNDTGMVEIECDRSDRCDCVTCTLEWLKQDM